jgi:hypothetical protein
MTTLQKRFARGELTREQYEEMKSVIQQDVGGHPQAEDRRG